MYFFLFFLSCWLLSYYFMRCLFLLFICTFFTCYIKYQSINQCWNGCVSIPFSLYLNFYICLTWVIQPRWLRNIVFVVCVTLICSIYLFVYLSIVPECVHLCSLLTVLLCCRNFQCPHSATVASSPGGLKSWGGQRERMGVGGMSLTLGVWYTWCHTPQRSVGMMLISLSYMWKMVISVTHACDATTMITFPVAGHRCPVTGTILYCLALTEAHVCEQLIWGCYPEAERPGVEPATVKVAVPTP